MNRLHGRKLFACSVAAGCLLLAGCDDQTPVPQAEARPVRALVAQMEEWHELASQVGEIQSHVESDLGFRISGRLVERPVKLGSIVRKGDVLAWIEQQDQSNQLNTAQAELVAAQANLTQADAEERRQGQLLGEGWTTRARYENAVRARDTARASVSAAEARRRLAQDQVGYSVLKASEDGAISAIGAEPGQVVAAGQMVVRLANLEKKDAVFSIAEGVVHRLLPGAAVDVRLLDAPQIAAAGTISQISPNADPMTRTYTVKVALSAPPDAMRLGMSVVGQVRSAAQRIIPLPAAALFDRNGAPAVWVVNPKDSTVDLVNVTLARHEANRVLVADGLREGAVVVTAGVQRLWPGLKVRLLKSTDLARAVGGELQ